MNVVFCQVARKDLELMDFHLSDEEISNVSKYKLEKANKNNA